MAQRIFKGIEEFYVNNEDRRQSLEVDFGVQWLVHKDRTLTWRVSWLEATGEVVAFNQRRRGGLVELLGVVHSREEIEAVLDGWEEACGSESSLRWVKLRLRKAGAGFKRKPMRLKAFLAREKLQF